MFFMVSSRFCLPNPHIWSPQCHQVIFLSRSQACLLFTWALGLRSLQPLAFGSFFCANQMPFRKGLHPGGKNDPPFSNQNRYKINPAEPVQNVQQNVMTRLRDNSGQKRGISELPGHASCAPSRRKQTTQLTSPHQLTDKQQYNN